MGRDEGNFGNESAMLYTSPAALKKSTNRAHVTNAGIYSHNTPTRQICWEEGRRDKYIKRASVFIWSVSASTGCTVR